MCTQFLSIVLESLYFSSAFWAEALKELAAALPFGRAPAASRRLGEPKGVVN